MIDDAGNGREQEASMPEAWREVEQPPEAAAVSHLLLNSSVGDRVCSHLGVTGTRLTFSTNELRRQYDEMGERERLLAEIAAHLWSGAFQVDLRRVADELTSSDWTAFRESLDVYRSRREAG
ncbi:MAG: hypothetical protein ABEJ46_02430 [Gemmatimonadota bacterium]